MSLFFELTVVKGASIGMQGDRDMLPVCVVQCGKETQKTKPVMMDGVGAVWLHSFSFGWDSPLTAEDVCEVKVMDTKHARALGSVVLNLKDFVGKDKKTLPYRLTNNENHGKLWLDTHLSSNPAGVRLQGTLSKLGGFLGGSANWKERWFVLHDSRLEYFKDQQTYRSNGEPKGVIVLDSFYCAPTDNADKFEFQVHAYPRSMILKAGDDAEMQKWIKGMNNHLQTFNQVLDGNDKDDLEEAEDSK